MTMSLWTLLQVRLFVYPNNNSLCVCELYRWYGHDRLQYELQGALLLFNAGAILNEKRVLEKCTWESYSSLPGWQGGCVLTV